ncbi:ABC transporter ATP-binding protein/permease [Terrarubrum flagellatum]|uniref:ABC transporter ATP-binding protein/permease n=1 Tax=Terrirubrum flagellatum TaxID=2895980 RepID=UPI003144D6C8
MRAGEAEASRRGFVKLASGFWSGPQRVRAWALTSGVLGFVILNVVVAYYLTVWNKSFFDTLEQKQLGELPPLVTLFAALVVAGALVNGALVLCRMHLQLSWRRWLSEELVARWLDDRSYYKLGIVEGDHDNPQFRIADDVRLAIEPLVDFAIGLLNAILSAFAFLIVLWAVGGALTVSTSWTGDVRVPGFFVLTAALYALIMSLLTVFVGRRLIDDVEMKNGKEADLRFELTRIKESAESIALIGGEANERAGVSAAYQLLAQAWSGVIQSMARITLMTNASNVILPIVCLLLGAPKYMSGEFTLGQLMQVSAAFVQVQLAFNWIMDNFIRLAEWRASANRVMGLVSGLDYVTHGADNHALSSIRISDSPDDAIHLIDLRIERDDGVVVIEEADVVIGRGESVMIAGESGTGKSTLIRAVAGLWPWGSGEIRLPKNASIMFVPQRPYIPLGSLREAVAYPAPADSIKKEDVTAALRRAHLEHLIERLDDVDRWDQTLSGGEQQRIAFARVFLSKPDILVMDEATSALDVETQRALMESFRSELSEMTLISVSHRPELEEYHARTVTLRREEAGVRLVAPAYFHETVWARWRRALAILGARQIGDRPV